MHVADSGWKALTEALDGPFRLLGSSTRALTYALIALSSSAIDRLHRLLNLLL
jgi:hypothetical protein